jgi:hypothetical protein
MWTVLTHVGFEVFTEVVMKSIIFWDVTPCSALRCNRRFGGTYRLHLQVRRKNFQQYQRVIRWQADLVQHRYQCRAFVNTAMNLQKGNLASISF